MEPNEKQLGDLARFVAATTDQEINCAEMLHRAAAYLQALTDRTASTQYLQQVAQHLEICPECREEFDALIRAEGLDPEQVLRE